MKTTHDYECDCGKPATRNIQQVWVEWKILPDGDFAEEHNLSDSNCDSIFLCDNCKY